MSIPFILIIVVVAVLVALSMKILKGAVKIVFSLFGILLLALIVVLGMAYLDAKKMQGLLEEGDKTVLYQQGEEVLAGIQVSEGSFLIEGEGELPENIEVFNGSTLDEYETLFAEQEPLPEDELVFIITNGTFADMEDMTLNNITITKEMFDAVMASDDPKETVAKLAIDEAGVPPEEAAALEAAVVEEIDLFTDEELKSALFLVAFSQYIEEEGEQAILEEVKEENIRIKPDFWIMRLIKVMPDTMFEQVMRRAVAIGAQEGGEE